MSDTSPAMRDELERLQRLVKELEEKAKTQEEELKLAIFDQIPFTIWAANRDFEIVLWNDYCKTNYGHSATEAVGRDYVHLFVDEIEAEDSRKDCLAVIDRAACFPNFLAYDHAKDGTPRTMLTNCFRVLNSARNEYIQVEVGIPAGELDWSIAKEKHKSLRDYAEKRRMERAELLSLHRTNLLQNISELQTQRSVSLTARLQAVEKLKSENSNNSSQTPIMTRINEQEALVKADIKAMHSWQRNLFHEATSAKTIEEITEIRIRIG